ncbi:UNVERIFIED_CONTAM: hypothetical protein K2H54_062127 [Gekko kuhli]
MVATKTTSSLGGSSSGSTIETELPLSNSASSLLPAISTRDGPSWETSTGFSDLQGVFSLQITLHEGTVPFQSDASAFSSIFMAAWVSPVRPLAHPEASPMTRQALFAHHSIVLADPHPFAHVLTRVLACCGFTPAGSQSLA